MYNNSCELVYDDDKLTPQQALDELCNHVMVYEEDYDWDENPCGEFVDIDECDLKSLREPLQELIDKNTPKKVVNTRFNSIVSGVPYDLCPNCGINLHTVGMFVRNKETLHYCENCGQRLDFGGD